MESNKKLFTVVNINGFEIRPWTLEQVELLLPQFSKIKLFIDNEKITFDNFIKRAWDFSTMLLPEISSILSITLNEDENKIKKFEMGTIIEILLVILTQNMAYLKNLLGPMTEILKNLNQKI